MHGSKPYGRGRSRRGRVTLASRVSVYGAAMRHDPRDRTETFDARRPGGPTRPRPFAGWLLGALLCGLVGAQDLTGRFVGDAEVGRVELTLELMQHGLVGVLEAPGVRLALDGDVSDGVGFGYAQAGGDVLGFEAYVDGDVVGLYLFELDARGNAIVDTAVELILMRVAGDPRGRPAGSSVATPAAPPPFAAAGTGAGTVDGVYADDRITLDVRSAPGGYVGEVGTADQRYALEAVATHGGMRGTFTGNGFVYDFVAAFADDGVRFETGGSVYHLVRQPPAVSGAGAGAPSTGTTIAHGSAADLSLDDAVAFIEALEFVLAQLGYAYRFTEAERAEALQTFALTFPTMAAEDQIVLAQARLIWDRVRANWPHADDRDRREFALGVLVLAFGEETVAQWVGPQGSAGRGRAIGGGAGCTSFDECASSFVDERTWTDTFNAQGCWAAAGCDGYDAGSGTFTYSDDW